MFGVDIRREFSWDWRFLGIVLTWMYFRGLGDFGLFGFLSDDGFAALGIFGF